MKKTIITPSLLAVLLSFFSAHVAYADVTLPYCLNRAEANYPMVKKYVILEKTTEISLSDINKTWLPRIGIYGQVTVQNAVPALPDALDNILATMGQDFEGLGKVQYKAGVDLTQTVWDGGASKAQREIERKSLAERQAALDVQIYAVRGKVTDLYFGILLIDEQMAQTENTLRLLETDLKTMQCMIKNGVAMQSDADIIEAQILTLRQQLTNARSTARGYRDLLSLFMGENIGETPLAIPPATSVEDLEPLRPELRLFDAQTGLNSARDATIKSTLMPKIGVFAQAYYGYPGMNYFESMRNRKLSFNVLAGLKISWNIDSFYTKSNARHKLALNALNISADREQFLFNTRLQTSAENEEITGLRGVIADDSRIVKLRTNVREAAESQLRNGVIDATSLLSKITDENQARLNARYHEIQLLHSTYKLKNTLNR